MLNKILSSLSIMVILASFFMWLDSRYASAEDVEAIKDRLEFKIVEDKLDSVEERLFKLMILKQESDELSKMEVEQYLRLESQKARLQKQYDQLIRE